MRLIHKETKRYTGADQNGGKLNEVDIQVLYREDLLRLVADNRDSGVYILNADKKWTKLLDLGSFEYNFNNLKDEFLEAVCSYLSALYDDKESFKKLFEY